jgi:hypothetical protein
VHLYDQSPAAENPAEYPDVFKGMGGSSEFLFRSRLMITLSMRNAPIQSVEYAFIRGDCTSGHFPDLPVVSFAPLLQQQSNADCDEDGNAQDPNVHIRTVSGHWLAVQSFERTAIARKISLQRLSTTSSR